MENKTINTDYGSFLMDLKEYEIAYLEYLREKERKRMHWVN